MDYFYVFLIICGLAVLSDFDIFFIHGAILVFTFLPEESMSQWQAISHCCYLSFDRTISKSSSDLHSALFRQLLILATFSTRPTQGDDWSHTSVALLPHGLKSNYILGLLNCSIFSSVSFLVLNITKMAWKGYAVSPRADWMYTNVCIGCYLFILIYIISKNLYHLIYFYILLILFVYTCIVSFLMKQL